MKHDVVAPSVGESISEVSILKWNKNDGDQVEEGEILLEIESDKATVEVAAESSGALSIQKQEGETIPVGEVIAQIDDEAQGTASKSQPSEKSEPSKSKTEESSPGAEPPSEASSVSPSPSNGGTSFAPESLAGFSPSIRREAIEKGVHPHQIAGGASVSRTTSATSGGSSGSSSVVSFPTSAIGSSSPAASPSKSSHPGDRRVPMSRLRKTIAGRLLQAQHDAAILTTFNEANMQPIMDLRKKYKEAFKSKHGVSLGFMSFFTRACVEALKLFPDVNAFIDGGDIIYHDYQDIGIAVGTDKGLVVPVLRNAQHMSFVDIEKKIIELAQKAKEGKLSISEMSGGTFTITNGGVYGSLLSTPILNPPQSAILGMHSIQERPHVVNGSVVAAPMMYLALSYDHRIIDGKGAVSFLVTVKEFLEDPQKLNLDFTQGL